MSAQRYSILVLILAILLGSMLVSSSVWGLTVSIPDTSAETGSSIAMPIRVTDFNNVGAVTLKIRYDNTVLDYTGVVSNVNEVVFLANATDGLLSIAWVDMSGKTPINFGDGVLLYLNFNVTGSKGSSTVLDFTDECELANGVGDPISGVVFNDGTFSVLSPVQLVSIDLTVHPGTIAFNGYSSFKVVALYSDGSQKDVTLEASYRVYSGYEYGRIEGKGLRGTNSTTEDRKVTVEASYGGKTDREDIIVQRKKRIPITLDTSPSNLSSCLVIDGVTYSSPQTFSWMQGSSHTIQVNSPIPAGTGKRYVFTRWSDESTANPRRITVGSNPVKYIVNYKIQYELGVNSSRGNPQGEGWYDDGSTANWSVTSPISGGTGIRYVARPSSGSVVMNGPKTVDVNWVIQYYLTTAVEGHGVIEPTPPGKWYDSGKSISIKVTPDKGYTFTGWSGDISGSANPISIVMDSPKSITAHFIKKAQPSIACIPESFNFTAIEGGPNPPSQTLTIWNSGTGTLDWQVSANASWISLKPSSGSSKGEKNEVTVSVDISGMKAGHTYVSNIIISGSGTPTRPQKTVPVTLTVSPPRQEVTFPDPNLEKVIREAIGKPTGPIYSSDLQGLTALHASERDISNLTGLEYCVSLRSLELNLNRISDISPLSNLTNLADLLLAGNQISNISSLGNLSNLRGLELSGNYINDVSPLSNLPKLINLNLSGNQISDISSLSKLRNLLYLSLVDNQISDISPLSNLTNLKALDLAGTQTSDISPLSNLTSLTTLRLEGNVISEISPISHLIRLVWLNLKGNKISNITPLSGLTDLRILFLDDNQIIDISPLSALIKLGRIQQYDGNPEEREGVKICLGLRNNEISDISPLVANEGFSEGDGIDLRGNPLSEKSLTTLIPQLKERGVNILYDVNHCPNQPRNISPANGDTTNLTPTLQSSAFSDPDAGDTHAASQWQITPTPGDYSSPVFDSGRDTENLTQLTIPSGVLNDSTTYYWRARHQDSHGAWSSWSSETSFTTVQAGPTITAEILTPQEGFTVKADSSLNITFRITCVQGHVEFPVWKDPANPPDLITIGVYLEQPRRGIFVSSDLWASAFDETEAITLNPGDTFVKTVTYDGLRELPLCWFGDAIVKVEYRKWKGSAYDIHELCELRGRIEPIPPESPVLLLPEDGAVDQPLSVTLKWEIPLHSCPGTFYRLMVDDDPSFSTPFLDDSLTVSSGGYFTSGNLRYYISNLSYSTTYYWRVNATNPAGMSDWSEIWSFTTTTGAVSQRDYTFQTTDNAVKVKVDTTWHDSPYTSKWEDETSHIVEVPFTKAVSEGCRYKFTGWSGKSTSKDTLISLYADSAAAGTYQANYKKQYTLLLDTDPSALWGQASFPSITPPPELGSWYDEGQAVTLTAPDTVGDYAFKHWKVDDTIIEGNPITVVMDSVHRATAFYGTGVTVKVDPPDTTVSLDSSFVMSILIEEVANMGAFEFTLEFDPSKLQVESLNLGDFLGSTGNTVSPVGPKIDNENGRATFGAFSFGANPGPSGSGCLATVTFSAKDTAEVTMIKLQNIQVTDKEGEVVPVDIVNGKVRITAWYWADINCDGKVNIVDIQLVAGKWSAKEGDENYDPRCDLDSDGDIDIVDIQRVAGQWGWPFPAKRVLARMSHQNGITVSIIPTEIETATPVNISIVVKGVENLGAFEFELGYLPDIIQLEDVKLGDFLSSTDNTASPVGPVIDNSTGRVTFGGFSFGANPGPSGSGTLATLTFNPVGTGSSPLEFISIQITDKEGNLLTISEAKSGVITDVEEETVQSLPNRFALSQNFPNPFNSRTTIHYQLPADAFICLKIFDISGGLLRTLVQGQKPAGHYTVQWDGKDNSGRVVASGIYFYRLEAHTKTGIGHFVQTRRMVFLK